MNHHGDPDYTSKDEIDRLDAENDDNDELESS